MRVESFRTIFINARLLQLAKKSYARLLDIIILVIAQKNEGVIVLLRKLSMPRSLESPHNQVKGATKLLYSFSSPHVSECSYVWIERTTVRQLSGRRRSNGNFYVNMNDGMIYATLPLPLPILCEKHIRDVFEIENVKSKYKKNNFQNVFEWLKKEKNKM